MHSVFSEEKQLSIAALSETMPEWLIEQSTPLSAISIWNCSLLSVWVHRTECANSLALNWTLDFRLSYALAKTVRPSQSSLHAEAVPRIDVWRNGPKKQKPRNAARLHGDAILQGRSPCRQQSWDDASLASC